MKFTEKQPISQKKLFELFLLLLPVLFVGVDCTTQAKSHVS